MNNYSFYELRVKCWNCYWKGTVTIPKGVEFSPTGWTPFKHDKAWNVCPNCGCDTVGKDVT